MVSRVGGVAAAVAVFVETYGGVFGEEGETSAGDFFAVSFFLFLDCFGG